MKDLNQTPELKPGMWIETPGYGCWEVLDVLEDRVFVEEGSLLNWERTIVDEDLLSGELVICDEERLSQLKSEGDWDAIVLEEKRELAAEERKAGYSLLDYSRMQDMCPSSWLIQGLLQSRTVAIMYGASDAFKSALAIDMACHVATGRHYHGMQTDFGRVCYVATQGASAIGRKRIPGWMDHRRIPPGMRRWISLVDHAINLDDADAVEEFLRLLRMQDSGGYNLVVIDMLGDSMSGAEVDDQTARRVYAGLKRISTELRATVLCVAHTGFADQSRARMHSHLWGAFDTRLKVHRHGRTMETTLSVQRHKDAPSDGAWKFRLDEVPTGLDEGATTLVPVVSGGAADEMVENARPIGAAAGRSLNVLKDELAKRSADRLAEQDWRAACYDAGISDGGQDARRKAFIRAKAELLDAGLIKIEDDHVELV